MDRQSGEFQTSQRVAGYTATEARKEQHPGRKNMAERAGAYGWQQNTLSALAVPSLHAKPSRRSDVRFVFA